MWGPALVSAITSAMGKLLGGERWGWDDDGMGSVEALIVGDDRGTGELWEVCVGGERRACDGGTPRWGLGDGCSKNRTATRAILKNTIVHIGIVVGVDFGVW